MRENHSPYIGAGGRWLIFAGLPLAVCAILFVSTQTTGGGVRGVSEKLLPYVLFFVPVAVVIGGIILYDHVPKRLVFPLGIVGWIVNASVLCWYFWFGPGAFGHH
jgi:hypothetical protein